MLIAISQSQKQNLQIAPSCKYSSFVIINYNEKQEILTF